MNWLDNKHIRVTGQGLLWILIWLTITNYVSVGLFNRAFTQSSYFILVSIIFILIWNNYVLIPWLFLPKRYKWYLVSLIGTISLLVVIADPFEKKVVNEMQEMFRRFRQMVSNLEQLPNPFMNSTPKYILKALIFMSCALGSIAIESVLINRDQEKKVLQIQQEKLETELKFLKSQINPHFLLNALNNIYGLSLLNSEQTPEVVMKLSEMLRYMLYESSHERVCLAQEISYINNFIDLHQLKVEGQLNVKTNLQTHREKVLIPPFLLIPFVENAFKHSKIEDLQKGWIKMDLVVQQQQLEFRTTNSCTNQSFTKDKTGGIGLKNVKRRLALLFPNKYQLMIKNSNGQFDVHLKIQLA